MMRLAGVLLALMLAPAAWAHPHGKQEASAIPAETLSPAARAVVAVVEQLHEAIAAGDLKRAEKVLDREVQIFEQGHREASRAEYFAQHFAEDADFARAVKTQTVWRDVRVTGELAVIVAETRTDGTYKTKPVASNGLATYVLARKADGWVIVHVHWSQRKRPAP